MCAKQKKNEEKKQREAKLPGGPTKKPSEQTTGQAPRGANHVLKVGASANPNIGGT